MPGPDHGNSTFTLRGLWGGHSRERLPDGTVIEGVDEAAVAAEKQIGRTPGSGDQIRRDTTRIVDINGVEIDEEPDFTPAQLKRMRAALDADSGGESI